jgi:transcriptional regulator with XRE-family HTH domain
MLTPSVKFSGFNFIATYFSTDKQYFLMVNFVLTFIKVSIDRTWNLCTYIMMKTEINLIGRMIKSARLKADMTQPQLAKKVGCSTPLISRYESGGLEPPLEILFRIENAMALHHRPLSGLLIETIYKRACEGVDNPAPLKAVGKDKPVGQVVVEGQQDGTMIPLEIKMPKLYLVWK